MTKTTGWVWGLVVLASMPACSAAHTDESDAGTIVLGDTSVPRDDAGPIVGDDGGGGVVIVADGALALPDGAFVDRDGGLLGGSDAGGTTGSDGGPAPRPDSGVAGSHVGDPCTSDDECPGLFCSTANNGFGYCSWVCGPGNPCPDDGVCYRADPMAIGYCMSRCDPAVADSCHVGWLCQPGIAEAPVCYPGCTTDAQCPSGTRCGSGVAGTRACYTPGAATGGECALSSECPELGYCLDEATWGAPGGLCVTFCDIATHSGCGTGTTCVPWGYGGGYGSCVPTCDASMPCRPGYECVPTGSGLPSACVARCTVDTDCTAPHLCNFVTGRCG